MQKFITLSLFANIGVAEAYLKNMNINVAVANELVPRRAELYSKIYPKTEMICGDITDDDTYKKIISESKKSNVSVIMAAPPCQGMSIAGKMDKNDKRNKLICPVINAIKDLVPAYVFIENVPTFFNTLINIDGNDIKISDLLDTLSDEYTINKYVIDTKDYSVPQIRKRAITLMTKIGEKEWVLPKKDTKIVTLKDTIGNLPMLDPFITDISYSELLDFFPHYEERKEEGEKISKWHTPPQHIKRQVVTMQHTSTGQTAFKNKVYYPKKENGERIKGYQTTYKRQSWDMPAYTITMGNGHISSQNNVHPGRLEYINDDGEEIYSDARVLTVYEIMLAMSIPKDWNIPDDTNESFLRSVIGEGIPPLFVKKAFQNILSITHG